MLLVSFISKLAQYTEKSGIPLNWGEDGNDGAGEEKLKKNRVWNL